MFHFLVSVSFSLSNKRMPKVSLAHQEFHLRFQSAAFQLIRNPRLEPLAYLGQEITYPFESLQTKFQRLTTRGGTSHHAYFLLFSIVSYCPCNLFEGTTAHNAQYLFLVLRMAMVMVCMINTDSDLDLL